MHVLQMSKKNRNAQKNGSHCTDNKKRNPFLLLKKKEKKHNFSEERQTQRTIPLGALSLCLLAAPMSTLIENLARENMPASH